MDESREQPDDDCYDEEALVEIAALARDIAREKVGDDVADDISQDIALECLIKMRERRWRVRRESIVGLVRRIVRRRIIDWRRRERRERVRVKAYMREMTTPLWMTPGADDEAREFEEFRERALTFLTPACLRTYLLVEQDRFTYAEVAEQLGVTRSAVAWQMSEARRRVREGMGTSATA